MSRKLTPLPPAERIRELLHYDASTGCFTWRVSRGTRRAGTVAGWRHSTGYWYIRIDGADYKLHRIAWVYVYGEAPAGFLDHIDRNPSNNRINNLREATHGENQQNKKAYANSLTGVKGVGWNKRMKKWRARIQHEGRIVLLGCFSSMQEAIDARKAAETALHTHAVKI